VLNLSNVGAWLGENLEDRDGFVPKTMLCLPIFNGQRDVIGVAQLINKVRPSNRTVPIYVLFHVTSCDVV
jgi:hypothetical protein